MSKWFKIELQPQAPTEMFVMVEDGQDWLDAADKAEDIMYYETGTVWEATGDKEVSYEEVPKNLRA